MKKLSGYIVEHIWAYLGGIICLIIGILLDMLGPQLTRHIIDDVIVGGDIAKLKYLLLGILGIGFGRFFFMYIKELTFDMLGTTIASDMRKNLFRHIQSLSTDFFDRTNTGELMSRVKDDIDRIWDALSYVIMLIIEVVIHVGVVLFCMYRLNWKLAILPTVAMIFCGILAIIMENKLGAVYEEISEENAELNTVAEENLAGVRTVKAFAREKHEISKFLSHNKRYYDLNMKQSKMFVRYSPLFTFVSKLLPIIIILIGGFFVINGEFSLGSLGAFIEYSTNIVWPMEMLGWLSNSFSSAIASNKKIKKIYNETAAVQECENPVVLPEVKGKVTFEHVSFVRKLNSDNTENKETPNKKSTTENKETTQVTTDTEKTILKDISFTLEAGKTLGIMGETGSGKSSLVYLLQRLYDCTDGTIYLDDTDIKSLTLKQLRGSIAPVMQDIFLFSDTITENIKLGKRDCTDFESIRMASHRAGASEFIEKMEEQYDTVIGERGVGLSGGQKQRISIARALSKKVPILVFDDSTSALDMETEHFIQQTLNSLTETTKIIIAHRISSVCHADEILILQDGIVAERGTHQELLDRKGLYYETYMAQYGEFLFEKEA